MPMTKGLLQTMTQPTKTSTAIEVLHIVKDVGTRLAESADGYLGMMESESRPVVAIGEFYSTFDGSVSYVARRKSKCTCPVCNGKAIKGPFGFMIAIPEEMQEQFNESHKVDDDNDPEFVVLVIRGGHGIKDLSGGEPGDEYIVNDEGLVIMGSLKKEDAIAKTFVAMAGLSLRRHIKVKIDTPLPDHP
jgi:hypothetical protein